MSKDLVPRYHHHRKRHRPLGGFAFDIIVRYNEETNTLIVTDMNDDKRRVFDTAKQVGDFITSQIALEISR